MAIKMTNWVLTWTDADGVHHTSGVGYDMPSAGHRKTNLEAEGCTDIEITEVQPGVLPAPKG